MTELRPEWTWIDGRLTTHRAIRIDGGRIAEVLTTTEPPDADLRGIALLPGFVNAHSHAFQWGLRGRVQQGRSAGSFFSWRDAMFALADSLDVEALHTLSRRAFRAMRSAGYTAVGEFHYLHHRSDGTPHAPATMCAEAVIDAARQEGLRICLLHAAYLRPSGLTADWATGQRRFRDPTADAFLARHAELARVIGRMNDPAVTLGVAPHSVRTVPAAALAQIAAVTTGPLHIHVNEVRKEIEESEREYRMRPLAVIAGVGALSARTTLIHMTHADEAELHETARFGARICFCGTTERDLGDGIGPTRAATQLGIPQCIGTDSQVQMDPFEEVRLLEGHERLRAEARLQLVPPDRRELGPHLLDIGTRGGADALALEAGTIEAGRWADFVEIDLNDPDLAGFDADILPEVIAFSATPRAVRATWVGGQRR